jgi:hypothetical protein
LDAALLDHLIRDGSAASIAGKILVNIFRAIINALHHMQFSSASELFIILKELRI